MAREDLHFRLRIPEDLKKQVEASALANDRSMTAEIVARLHQTFEVPVSIPDALMGRIAAYAKRQGRTPNEEINRLLEREYPEQWDVDDRMEYLAEMLAILKGGTSDSRIDHFIREVRDTVEGVMSGRVKGVTPQARGDVESLWQRYQERSAEDAYYESAEYEYDEEETRMSGKIGRPEKLAEPLPDPRQPLRDYLYLSDILPPQALAELREKLGDADIEGAVKIVANLEKSELVERIRGEKLSMMDRLKEDEQALDETDPFNSDA